ncbi:MAG: DUF3489 domain-containing protein [Acidobacteria bacterium]|nr:DUF3489 domain-containing protein [Acidobacteriota bacterium]
MKTFTIDNENNITVFASQQQAKASDQTEVVLFSSQEELAKLSTHWPTHRLVDLWNSLPGFTPVKKFTDRKTAIARIWKAIQSLQPTPEAEEKAAPARDIGTGRAAEAKSTAKAKGRKKAAQDGDSNAKEAREGSKKAAILELLRRPDGATLKDLMDATGWQGHSVRGFISGAIVKKMGLRVESTKHEDGERRYSVAAQ